MRWKVLSRPGVDIPARVTERCARFNRDVQRRSADAARTAGLSRHHQDFPMDKTPSRPPADTSALSRRNFLKSSATAALGTTLAAAKTDAASEKPRAVSVREENAKEGARVRLAQNRWLPRARGRGLLLEAVRPRRRIARHHGEHESACEFYHRDFPHQLLRRTRRAAHDHARALHRDDFPARRTTSSSTPRRSGGRRRCPCRPATCSRGRTSRARKAPTTASSSSRRT